MVYWFTGSELDSSFLHFLRDLAVYLAAIAVLCMFEVPLDTLVHRGVLRHFMRLVPGFVDAHNNVLTGYTNNSFNHVKLSAWQPYYDDYMP